MKPSKCLQQSVNKDYTNICNKKKSEGWNLAIIKPEPNLGEENRNLKKNLEVFW